MGKAGRIQVGAVLALLAIGAMAGAMLGGMGVWLHWLCKPAATLWLIAWVARMPVADVVPRYRGWVLAGLCLSLLGDVLLMLPQELFVPGLVAFLLAHVCYVIAFAPGSGGWTLLPAMLLMAVIGGGNLYALWPSLPASMQLPVSAYVLVISMMAVLALSAAFHKRARVGAWLAASGALLFVLSDSLLAWNRFAGPLPLSIIGVLATYWAAQYLIAASCQARTDAPAATP